MITNFKIFENIEELKLENFSYWIIYGSQLHCIDILMKLRLNLNSDLRTDLYTVIGYIKTDIKEKIYFNVIKTLIFREKDNFSYYPYEKKDDERKEEIEEEVKNYNFKGEIKEVDGKIIVDTFEVDVKKYNL